MLGSTLDTAVTAWRLYIVLMLVLALALTIRSLVKNRLHMSRRDVQIKRALITLLGTGIVGVGGRVAIGVGALEWLSATLIYAALVLLTLGPFHVIYAMSMPRDR